MTITLRSPILADSDRLTHLCCQSGYSTTQAAFQQRLQTILNDQNHTVGVAELPNEGVVGWVHVYIHQALQVDQQGIIGGLVVEANHRHQGVGKLLLSWAEQWVHQQGCQTLIVRSNLMRQQAHRFYQRMGYTEIKRSIVFHKSVESANPQERQDG
jgi:GNAT superfamily N-acetyltransferase